MHSDDNKKKKIQLTTRTISLCGMKNTDKRENRLMCAHRMHFTRQNSTSNRRSCCRCLLPLFTKCFLVTLSVGLLFLSLVCFGGREMCGKSLRTTTTATCALSHAYGHEMSHAKSKQSNWMFETVLPDDQLLEFVRGALKNAAVNCIEVRLIHLTEIRLSKQI